MFVFSILQCKKSIRLYGKEFLGLWHDKITNLFTVRNGKVKIQ